MAEPAPGGTDDAQDGPRGLLTVRVVAMPADTNPSGDIFGGWIMGVMDLSAGIAGRDRARGRVVTAHVSGLSFLHPVKVGDLVCCHTSVSGVRRTSMEIDVETWVERKLGTAQIKVTQARFVMVAVDEAGRPRPVDQPPGEAKAPG